MWKFDYKFFTMLFLAVLLCNNNVDARKAVREDAPFEYLFFNRDTMVKANGQLDEEIEYAIKILNERGRDEANQKLYFNEAIGHIEVLEAKTIVNGKEYKVEKDKIETKPLASSSHGFDQHMQVMVSFPRVAIGSEIRIKYKQITKQQPFPDYFSTNYNYGKFGFWNKSTVHLRSEIPFNVHTSDASKHLEVTKGNEGKLQTLKIELKKPIYDETVNEHRMFTVCEPADATWVVVTSANDVKQQIQKIASKFEEVIKQPLPSRYEKIKLAAMKEKTDADKINTVTSMLSETINYMGDWQTIDGMLFPRPLEVASKSGAGDCKDYSAATAAILNAMGFKAQVAFVSRGENFLAYQNDILNFENINHAIVKVTDNAGKVLWIDPTNMVSFATGIFPDIANRQVFVIDSKQPTVEAIPDVNPDNARSVLEYTMSVKNKNAVVVNGSLKQYGESALMFTGERLHQSEQMVADHFLQLVSTQHDLLNKKVILPDLESRVVKDREFTFSYEKEGMLLPTTAGLAVMVNSWNLNVFLDLADDSASGLFIGFPKTRKIIYNIKNTGKLNLKNLEFKIDNAWVQASRVCEVNGDDIKITETVKTLKSYIPNKEIRSKEFSEFKKFIRSNCSKFAVVLAPGEQQKS